MLVVNAEFSVTTILNAVAHTVLGMVTTNGFSTWNPLPYRSPGFGVTSNISEYPVIVLRSKRSSQLEKLVQQLADARIVHNVFIDSMLGASAADQQAATFSASPGENRIVCVGLFGQEDAIRTAIKSFSLYKTSDALSYNGPETS
ncbi:DUF2000 domain-containing protein [Paraburkholderia sp. RAU2J]|uniref:DUF2000 domain-containing protein n=1 Tax=Paraburkholderia sp. RAU2J TaxID=1938810 RepID=UPI001F542CAC|nr:DUF2000 domain-containing protein [Paraburkholderia sp. RAU2J]